MKDLNEILSDINKCIDDHATCKLGTIQTQLEISRTLAVNLKWLGDYKVYYKEQWNKAFMESTEKSDKKKEIDADTKVPELYLIRNVLRYTEKNLDTLRTSVSANKNG